MTKYTEPDLAKLCFLCLSQHFSWLTINGMLWILRTGAPWRDLPGRYGAWETVAGRFYRWCKNGLWQKILQSLQQQADALGQ